MNSFLPAELGYSRSVCDPCLYYRISASGQSMLLGLFVDDILSTFDAADAAEWNEIKSRFMRKYPLKDIGEAELVLGMRITRDRRRRSIVLDQQYVEKILRQFNMHQCNSAQHTGGCTREPVQA